MAKHYQIVPTGEGQWLVINAETGQPEKSFPSQMAAEMYVRQRYEEEGEEAPQMPPKRPTMPPGGMLGV